jgi:hypothetical protein
MVMHDVFDRLLGIPRTWTNRDWLIDAEEKPAQTAAAKVERLSAARKKDLPHSLPLSQYCGDYECDLYGKLEVFLRDGSLRVRFGPNIAGDLLHWEQDTFRAKLTFPPGEEWLVRFEKSCESANRLHIQRLFWDEPMPVFQRIE